MADEIRRKAPAEGLRVLQEVADRQGLEGGHGVVEGLLVAGSGFLPDSADKFIVNFVFPAFTPSVGVFLLISVFYGLFKTKVEPK